MKFTRYLVIAAGIVAALAVIAWFLRDSLIERLSNPLLHNYGIRIVDVSLDALAARDASIGYLELEHEKGTTIVIEGLTLPFAAASKRSKTFIAEKVSVITTTRTAGETFELALLIRQILSLPDNLDRSLVIVEEFELAPYPPVRGVRWEIAEDQQYLQGNVGSVTMSTKLQKRDTEGHDVIFSVADPSGDLADSALSAVLMDEETRILLDGGGAMDLPSWQPLARLSGLVPSELEIVAGAADLTFEISIPDDAAQAATVAADFLPRMALRLNHAGAVDTVSILVSQADSAKFAATFPDVDWSLQLHEASLNVSYGDWQAIPLHLRDVACKAGPVCSMISSVTIDKAKLPVGQAAQVALSATETVRFLDSGVRIDVQPGAALKISDLAKNGNRTKRVEAQLASAAVWETVDGGWRLSAESVDAEVEGLSLGEAASISMPLFLEKLNVASKDDALELRFGTYVPSSQATLGDKAIALPGARGNVTLQGNEVTAELTTVGLHEDAIVRVRHDLGGGAGQARLADAMVSFGKEHLSGRIAPWPVDRDVVAGTVSIELSADWSRRTSGIAVDAQASITATDLAGYYGDTAFTGLSTELSARYRAGVGFIAEPSIVTASLVEVGIPVENLSARYLLDLNRLSAEVNDLRMSALGGVVTADPFSFHTDTAMNTLTLRAESLDLAELLTMKEFEAINVTGRVGATLPLVIEGDTTTIVDGLLSGEPPGGVIRYVAGDPSGDTDASSLGFAKRVLSNFEFDTLTSDVNLSKEGDLVLQLRLTGRNPDLDEKRPVVLNLGVENNIPQMLRSLRAARAVEDILERRLNR